AAAQLATLRTKSPQSMKVSLRLVRDGRSRTSFAEEMAQEYAIGSRVAQSHDFIEGVRALIVDKDNAPAWNPATPEAVSD
ncbi:enoyl-CoA hydratase/isomerase family protein, partial [Escherichia coli]|nr:enoyl-CoA hydratase/isomerase family protein [Escherichia coli]